MKHLKTSFLLLALFISTVFARPVFAQQSGMKFTAYNRSIEQLTEYGRAVLRFSEGTGAGLAWINGIEFIDGTIEFEAKGRDVMQKSFLGIAFHGVDSSTYETVYFRPFNFQSQDPNRKIHAVQYSFEPKFGFQQLRDTRKDEFEAAILPADIKATDWFRAKIVVKNKRITVFINGSEQPCMQVTSLNNSPAGKKIGFWVGNFSNGDFANFKISR